MILRRVIHHFRNQEWTAIVLDDRLSKGLEGMTAMRDGLWEMRPAILTDERSEPLSNDECWLLAASHAAPRLADRLPTLDELLSTGRIDILEDDAIKSQLREFEYYRAEAGGAEESAITDIFRLASRHPDFLKYEYVPIDVDELSEPNLAGIGYRHNVSCDADELRASAAFRNDYVDNMGRLSSNIFKGKGMRQRLTVLQNTLAAEIGVVTQADAP